LTTPTRLKASRTRYCAGMIAYSRITKSAVAPLGPPAREQDPKQPIPKAKARATSSAALQHGDLMAHDRFQQQHGAGSGLAVGERQRCACRHRHVSQAIARRSKPSSNSCGLGFEEQQWQQQLRSQPGPPRSWLPTSLSTPESSPSPAKREPTIELASVQPIRTH
jgi:hypothetical protein